MTLDDIDVSDATVKGMVAKFQWLMGLDADSDPALLQAAETDVCNDGVFFVKLAGPDHALFDWFKLDDWSIY